MKQILATVMLRDEAGTQLGRFTSTVDVPDNEHVKAAGDAVQIAAGEALAEFIRQYLPLVEAEMQGADLDQAKAAEARKLTDEIAPHWADYARERAELDKKYPGLRTKRRSIKRILDEVGEANRKRVLRDD